MKLYKYYALGLLSLMVLIIACKKLPDGFLSDGIRYEEDPVTIPQGRALNSTALNVDGSTQPMKIKVVHFYDKATGKIVDEMFFKTYKIKVWTGIYDPTTDVTEALIAKKQKDSLVNPIHINDASGQVQANYTSSNIPVGNYTFDLEISNPAGKKVYPKIGNFNVTPSVAYELPGTPYNQLRRVGNEAQSQNIGVPTVTIVRTPSTELKVILRMLDKNGVAFNPLAGEIVTRPLAGLTTGALQTMKDYAIKTVMFNDRMEFTFGTVPFPLVSLGNGFNYYYRIPTQFVKFDNPTLGLDQWSSNPRFVFQSFQDGIYNIDLKFPDMSHR
ncbi:DUF5007 domain-containing protein [Pedobacter frigiditerrae]|uniref:DUF5007 domain-containing protein n=1 Tax=Pedobacter frigiditerrae TaxID=2530452 RepID=A0A4R0MMR3_9SPHI|nr:DUF5007 domain-containing protein [Pedobacter frigiditerrae]TCC88010.1 DUF5007 domain-containing protein [Pedobacter frigiditerrae]